MSKIDDFYTTADEATAAITALQTWATTIEISRAKRVEIDVVINTYTNQVQRTRTSIDAMAMTKKGKPIADSVLSSRTALMIGIRDECLKLVK